MRIIRVPSGSTSSVTDRQLLGSSDWAEDQVSCVVLMVSSSIGARSSADRRVPPVTQKVSRARAMRRW